MRKAILLSALLWLLLISPVAAGTDDAIVRVERPSGGAGSGVCVDPSGLVVSIKHVVASGPCRVHFPDGTSYAGRVVVESEKSDFPVVIRLAGVSKPLPFLAVADKSPPVGETVWYCGYPGAVKRNGRWIRYDDQRYTVIRSSVFSKQVWLEEDQQPGRTAGDVHLFSIAAPVFFGGSGGPCLNKNAEVVGIVTTTAGIPESMIPQGAGRARNQHDSRSGEGGGRFTETYHVRAALLQASMADGSTDRWTMPTEGAQPTLVVLSAAWCQGCVEFKRRAAGGTYGGLPVVYVERTNSGGWSDQRLFDEFQAATGPHDNVTLPTLWVRGSKDYRVWDARQHSIILDWLGGIVDALLGLRRERDKPPQQMTNPPAPEQQQLQDVAEEQADEPSEPDWSYVKVVVIAAEQAAKFSEVGRKYLLKLGIGPLERAIASRSNGKATVEVVAERIAPARYEAVTRAVGQSPEKFLVVVLVKRQDLGLKGLIAYRIESAVREKLGETSIDVLFEREHPADFAAVELALTTQDAEAYERADDDADLEPIPEEPSQPIVTPPVESSTEEKSLPESIVATLLLMLTGGMTGAALKAKLKERALNKVKDAALKMLGRETDA